MPNTTSTRTAAPKKRKKKPARSRHWRTAAESDRHELYELAVQEPDVECDFLDSLWKERRRRLASSLREDFCGTAIASIAWVKRRRTNTAVGVDIDPAVLRHAHDRIEKRLTTEQRQRLTILQGDVLTAKTPKVDCVVAMNFSYYLFKTRPALLNYFKAVKRALKPDGLFVMDAYGGSDSFLEQEETRDLDGYTYVWHTSHYNPINGDVLNHIHFRFPDGTEIKNAFTYDWRLWTLPEIQELLVEAGFRNVAVYWEGTNRRTGEGDGVFKRTVKGDACPGWIAYIVAEA